MPQGAESSTVPHTPGWMILTRKAAEVAGLAVISRLLEEPVRPRAAVIRGTVSATPPFISEIVDNGAAIRRASVGSGDELFAGFYSDGRVRLATPEGRRFSGILMERRAVIADLREDDSFEMRIVAGAPKERTLVLEMDGGPWDGQTLQCETL